ncbi:MAG: dual specificity protein phosphatase family protein [Chloroflexi bacterium]|nr:dual specificity protein phosphatase family protein [Chloroflexota bacterium]
MDKIRSWLFIGKYRDTLNKNLLVQFNITAMLQLAELIEHPGITSLYLPVEDGEPLPSNMIKKGIRFINQQKDQGNPILVACGAGISRSAAFSIIALHEVEGIGLHQAFHITKKARDMVLPHPVVWNSLCAYYNVDIPWNNLFDSPTNGDL